MYKSRDNQIPDINLDEIFANKKINKLTHDEQHNLGKLLTTEELAKTIKSMKNNKAPGVYGFPAEFLKIFWCKISLN